MQLRDMFFSPKPNKNGFSFPLRKRETSAHSSSAFKDFPLLSGREMTSTMFPFLEKILKKYVVIQRSASDNGLASMTKNHLQGNMRSLCYQRLSV